MKNLVLIFGFVLCGLANLAPAQPAPEDSIIIESKTVQPQAGTGGVVRLKVYITNKDTLGFMRMSLVGRSISGGAYMTLAHPWDVLGVWEPLTNTLRYNPAGDFSQYDGASPDRFKISAGYGPSPEEPLLGAEPPNAARKGIWELKFDTVLNRPGTMEFDSTTLATGSGFAVLENNGQTVYDIPVNFLKSVVTVPLKGDLDLNFVVRPADVVLELYCVYLGQAPPAGPAACDLNCDGEITPADVTVFLMYKFATLTWPC